ncbi:MAG: hypothetical protein VB948_05795 [Pseudomonadales bacterium]|jgi:hypothetical protein
MDESKLLWGLLFGSIGFGYLIYGRKQRTVVPFVAGIALMASPYFIETTVLLLLAGMVLLALPFVIKL